MHRIFRATLFFTLLLGTLFLSPYFVSAQTATTTPVDTQVLIRQLQDLVASLQKQILELQTQLKSTKGELAEVKAEVNELKITQTLTLGSSGEEVKQLQEYLKQDPEIYPEGLVTGFYGSLTEKAVRKFQEKHGIETLGIIGPKTRTKLNELFTQGAGESAKFPPGLLKAPGMSKESPTSTAATTTPSGKIIICHSPPGNPENKQTLEIDDSALPAHLGHGDAKGACGILSTPPPPLPPATTTPPTSTTTPPVSTPPTSPPPTTSTGGSILDAAGNLLKRFLQR